jgi:hypothetical protein
VRFTVCDIPAQCKILDELSRKLDCTLVSPRLNQSVKTLLRLATPYGVFYRHPRQTLSSLATFAPDTTTARSCARGSYFCSGVARPTGFESLTFASAIGE